MQNAGGGGRSDSHFQLSVNDVSHQDAFSFPADFYGHVQSILVQSHHGGGGRYDSHFHLNLNGMSHQDAFMPPADFYGHVQGVLGELHHEDVRPLTIGEADGEIGHTYQEVNHKEIFHFVPPETRASGKPQAPEIYYPVPVDAKSSYDFAATPLEYAHHDHHGLGVDIDLGLDLFNFFTAHAAP